MADIELVIKISEETYTHLLTRYMFQNTNDIGLDDNAKVGVAIKNGTPLPKGHGRLIDEDMIVKYMLNPTHPNYHDIVSMVHSSPTIVKVDKEVNHESCKYRSEF